MRFPDVPMFRGIHAPSRIEVDLNDLEVDGEVPRDLNGAFYRVAPDFQFPPRFADDGPFNADGAISRSSSSRDSNQDDQRNGLREIH